MILGVNPGQKLSKKCETCGKIFFYKNTRKNPKFCSRKCQNNSLERKAISSANGQKNKGQRRGKENPNWQGGGEKFVCRNCNKKFFVPRHEIKKGKRHGIYCCIKCRRLYQKEHKMPIIQKRLHINMRRSILSYIKRKNRKSWIKLLGYTVEDLMNHLEKQFSVDMNWANYGKWHIDHIKPVSAFDFNNYSDVDFHRCWALSNLQPLWAKDNISKGGVRCH